MLTHATFFYMIIWTIKKKGCKYEIKRKRLSLIAIVIVLGVFQFINHTGPFQENGNSDTSSAWQLEKVHVERCDGDMLVAKNSD